MKTAYVITARDKAKLAPHVERCVLAAFAQKTREPIDIILSDQGSTDGTRELLQRLADGYRGPHTVRVLDCPDTAHRGMAGMNAHVAWVMNIIDAEYVLLSSADDFSEPGRTEKTVAALERTGADMVGTAMWFADPDKPADGRSAYAREGWVSVTDMLKSRIGGSAAMGLRRSFWQRLQPIPALCGYDVYLPPMACVLGGYWYIDEPLHTYVRHGGADNLGLEGVLRGIPEAEHRPVHEHMHFEIAGSYKWITRRMQALGVGTPEDRGAVGEMLMGHLLGWHDTRTEMTLSRQAPQPYRI